MSDYTLVLYHSASQGKSSYLNVKYQLLFPDGFYRSMEKKNPENPAAGRCFWLNFFIWNHFILMGIYCVQWFFWKKPNQTKNQTKNQKIFAFHAAFMYTVSHQRISLKRENTSGIWALLCWLNGDACHASLNLLMTRPVFWLKYFFPSSYLCHSSSFSVFVLLDGTSSSHPLL